MKNGSIAVVVLAAGKGTRMKSDLPKVLHQIDGKSLIVHVLTTASRLQPERIVVVVGHQWDLVIEAIHKFDVKCVIQEPLLGTGHAVKSATIALEDFEGDILVLSGDVPLLRVETLQKLIDYHKSKSASSTVLTVEASNPSGYGRIVRGEGGRFLKIVEDRDATPEIKKIHEINSGIYCFKSESLWPALDKVQPNKANGEYYLTDVLGIMVGEGSKVEALKSVHFREVQGINTPEELANAEASLKGQKS